MRILVITAWYPSAEEPTAGLFIRQMAQTASRRHRTEVLAFHILSSDAAQRVHYSVVEDDGIIVHRVGIKNTRIRRAATAQRLLYELRAGARVIRRFRPDLIHCHSYPLGLAAGLLSRWRRIPVILSEHFSGLGLRNLPAPEYFKARLAYRLATLVAPVSRFLCDKLSEFCPEGKLTVLPNVIDTGFYRPSSAEAASVPASPARLVTVGSLVPVKAHKHLLQTVAMLKERELPIHLTIAGDGPLREELVRMTSELGITDEVDFLGFLSPDKLLRLYQRSHLFVISSDMETFSCATAEAMACGLPVAAPRVGALPELVDEDSGVIAASNAPADLAQAIERALGSRSAYHPETIANRVRTRFGVEAAAERLDAIYRQAAPACGETLIG